MLVRFYEYMEDAQLRFAVIIAKHKGKWVFCKHRARSTYELPGGHREPGESVLQAAKRELYEETGALQFDIVPVCVYSVTGKNSVNPDGAEVYDMLYFADVDTFEDALHSEIERISLLDVLPTEWTYPQIHPRLIQEYLRRTEARS